MPLVDNGLFYACAKQLGELCGVYWAAEEVALSFGALLGLKKCSLVLGFDALGDHQMFEALSHANDSSYNLRVIAACGDLLDERPIYLQYVNGKLTKIAQAGVAGAEVIHSKAYTHLFQIIKHANSGFSVIHENAFGKLEFKISGFESSFRKYVSNSRDKSLIAKLDGGNVNRQRNQREPGLLPRASLRACFAERPTADLDD
jgi:hypothetical protein